MAPRVSKINNMALINKIYIAAALTAMLSGTAVNASGPAKAKREQPIELFRKAEQAAESYRFNEAAELLENYSDALPRRGKAPVSDEEFDALKERVERGQLMMDRVEKIVVIDSIAVPKESFFKAFRLDPSAGTLRESSSSLPKGLTAVDNQPVFVPENGLSMIWSMPDSSGRGVIAEVSLLADGSYEPVVTHPELNVETENTEAPVNALFPFMMADGVTLYFAMDNPELSMGGLDIFFTRRSDDEFMQPQNVGMPYNSPADDYMLAIDETTGTGWWATERNAPGADSVTIYRFIPNELRVNYNASETPNLASLARLDSWKATQPEGADYSKLLALPLNEKDIHTKPEISIAIPGKGIVTSIGNLRSAEARRLAKEYIATSQNIEKSQARLDSLRKDYSSGRRTTASEITSLERRISGLRDSLKNLRNQIIKAER